VIVIRFTRNAPPYAAGECAGFDDAAARRFIKLGAAELAVAPQREADEPVIEQPQPESRDQLSVPARRGRRPKE